MHRCLQIDETVREIFSYFAPPEDDCDSESEDFNGPSCLASLARTCTTFKDPALDVLWATNEDALAHLIQCLPEDALWRSLSVRPHEDISFRFSRALIASDWERPLEYINRVRTVKIRGGEYSAELFEMVASSFPGDFIFPRLERLELSQYDQLHLRLLLSRTVRVLHVICDISKSAPHLSLLSTLSAQCSSLTQVILSLHFLERLNEHGLSSFLNGLQSVESLGIVQSGLDELAFHSIASLPVLRCLTLGHSLPFLNFTTQTLLSPNSFPALRDIHLVNMTASICTKLITICNHVPFDSVEISFHSFTLGGEIESFVIALSRCQRIGNSMFDLQITNSRLRPRDNVIMHECTMTASSLRMLALFANLTNVYLCFHDGFELDDLTMSEIVKGCRRLTSLVFLEGVPRSSLTEPSFYCLPTIAQYCRELRELVLAFDTSEIPVHPLLEADLATTKPEPQTHLTELNIRYTALSSVRDPLHVASFLFSLFPSLQCILSIKPWSKKNDLPWAEDDAPGANQFVYHRRWMAVQQEYEALQRKAQVAGIDLDLN